MKKLGIIAFLIALSLPMAAQDGCKDTMQALSPTALSIILCTRPFPAQNDSIAIESGRQTVQATVTASVPFFGGQNVAASSTQTDVLKILGDSTATLKFGGREIPLVVLQPLSATNRFKYKWSIGPATEGDEDGESEGEEGTPMLLGTTGDDPAEDDDSNTGAMRFQYEADYARGGLFGTGMMKLLQTTAAVSIDTTDQDSEDFIDNNRASLTFGFKELSFGRLFMHGDAGIEARYEKAFHRDIHNTDAVVKVSGWIPTVPPVSLFGKRQFITVPLTFSASYGYRDRRQAGESFDGRVFEASALYHFFLLDQFMVSVNGTLTVNDLSNRTADVPRTQRMYKATIAYLQDPNKPNEGFKLLTSVENGSFGVMLKDVRQYFIGVGFSKLNAFGGGN